VADLPFLLADSHAARLRQIADVEGKIVRALEALGPLAGRNVIVLDVPDGPFRDRLAAAGIDGTFLPLAEPLAIEAADASADAVVSLWSGFRGVDTGALREVDRVLRPNGRLLVVHDYGRDDVSALRGADVPEYGAWSRRDGPFLRGGGFRIRVVHCFWTFPSLPEARDFLGQAFGTPGRELGTKLTRPRLTWNVAIYHRDRGGRRPAAERADVDETWSRDRVDGSGTAPGH
jgi:SAM-dependent methyltransferase